MGEEGATAIVSDIDLDAATSVAEAIVKDGFQAEALRLDISDESSWQTAVDEILGKFGPLDILVNSAGITLAKPMTECTIEQ